MKIKNNLRCCDCGNISMPKAKTNDQGEGGKGHSLEEKGPRKGGECGIKLSLGQSGEGQRSEKQERSKERDGGQVTWEGALVHT